MVLEQEEAADAEEMGDPILRSEFARALKDPNRNKAPGIDKIPSDLLTAVGGTSMARLFHLVCNVYQTGEVPPDFRQIVVSIPKKAGADKCGNYRTISSNNIKQKDPVNSSSKPLIYGNDTLKMTSGVSSVASTFPKSSKERSERRHPVQRAPSRLYRPGAPPDKYRCPNTCIGPEFIVRASQPCRLLHLGTCCTVAHRRKVVVILLSGQKIEITCDPSVTTARQIFEIVVQTEGLTENFTLGLAALLGGDFVFLRPETRISKVAPSSWSGDPKKYSLPTLSFTLYLRVKFFLPSLRGVRNWSTKHLLYLQLRKSLLEQQVLCSKEQHLVLGGLALQAEFGDYSDQEHGCGEYFLLEHYLPEVVLHGQNETELKAELQKRHQQRHGLDPGRAEEAYITQVQSLPHYGCHFHSAICVFKSGCSQVVWVAVKLQGIFLYQRMVDKPLLQSFLWCQLQNLSYSRHCFYMQPHGQNTKYKLCMDHHKSFFLFHLASLHHKFFLKLRSEMSSLKPLSEEFGVPVNEEKADLDTTVCTERTSSRYHTISRTTASASQSKEDDVISLPKPSSSLIRSCSDATRPVKVIDIEEYQNKENEKPEHMRWTPKSAGKTSSHPRRLQVKMGTKAFFCTAHKEFFTPESAIRTQSHDDMESLPSLPSLSDTPSEAYVLNSSIKSIDETFQVDLQESLSESLMEKIGKISFEEERILRSVRLRRGTNGSLGVQISKGEDGGVYIHSVMPNGPAALLGTVHKGDKVVAVDSHNLLNMKYEDALQLLLASGDEVELVLSQFCASNSQSSSVSSSAPLNLTYDVQQKSSETVLEGRTADSGSNLQHADSIVSKQMVGVKEDCVQAKVHSRAVRCIKYPAPPVPSSRESIRAVCCVAPVDEDSEDILVKEREEFL
ncbi:tyrosine-protein phosphatase non-receptor type 13 [Anabrus simplex]|uniref:tyrosine-protein phosphatase non-receptor type 13 n=1 Tax=Anabrus simplex TaxID=316456 RepID=UPI0035A2A098